MRKWIIFTVTGFFLLVTVNGLAAGRMTKYLSIPGCGFLPQSDLWSYYRAGSDVDPHGGSSDIWFSPLHLPGGARIGESSLAAMVCGTRTDLTHVQIVIMERDLLTQESTVLVELDIRGKEKNCTLVQNPPPQIESLISIDNETKTYYIAVDGLTGEGTSFGDLTLRAVRIAYYVSAGFKLD